MCTHPLCLLLLTVGQLGLPSDGPSREEFQAPALPAFQPPDSLQIKPTSDAPAPQAAPSWGSGPVYDQNEGKSAQGTPSIYSQNNDGPAAPSIYSQNGDRPAPSIYSRNDNNPPPAAPVSSPPASLRTTAAPLETGASRSTIGFSQSSPAEPNVAKTLLKQTLRSPSESAIDGTPVALQKIVQQARAREQQIAAVRAYWRLSELLAAYHFAIEESQFFRDLPLPQVQYQQALLTSREASAKAVAATAHLAAIQAQHELARIAPLAMAAEMPLPADIPFVGVYQTHFKVLNESGAAPDGLRPIDQTLPAMRASIQALAEAALTAEDALSATRRAYESGQAALREVLGLHAQLHRQRREFLSAVSQYNEQIARYAFSVSRPGATADRVVGMLIESPNAMRSVLASKDADSNVRRVSNEEEIGGWTGSQPGNR